MSYQIFSRKSRSYCIHGFTKRTSLIAFATPVPSTEFHVIEARGFARASANRGHDPSEQLVRELFAL